jgi:hypothetical protein
VLLYKKAMTKLFITFITILFSITASAQRNPKRTLSIVALNDFQNTLNYEWHYASNKDAVRSVLFQHMRINGVYNITDAFEVIQTVKTSNKSLITVLQSLRSAASQYKITLNNLLIGWGMKSNNANEVASYCNYLTGREVVEAQSANIKQEVHLLAQRIIRGEEPVTVTSINESLQFRNLKDVTFKINKVDTLLKLLSGANATQELTFVFGTNGSLSKIEDTDGKVILNSKDDSALSQSIVLEKPIQLFHKNSWHNVMFATDRFKVNIDSSRYTDTYIFSLGKNHVEPYHGDIKRLPRLNLESYKFKDNFDIDSIQNDLLNYFNASTYSDLRKQVRAKYRMDALEVAAMGLTGAVLMGFKKSDNMIAVYKKSTVKYQLVMIDKSDDSERVISEFNLFRIQPPTYKHFN